MSINKHTIKVYFTKERSIFLFSFLLAFIFWFVVKLSKEYRTSNEITIVWEISDTLSWASPPPKVIHINHEGEGWSLLGGLASETIQLRTIGLPVGKTFWNRREILKRIEKHLGETKIIDFTPDNFVLNLDRNMTKKLSISPQVEPELKSSLVVYGNIHSDPDSVLVAGPSQILQSLKTIKTTTWRPNIQQAKSVSQTLFLLDPTKTLSFQPKQVILSLTTEELTEKSFFVPISIFNTNDSVRIFPDQIKITFSIPLSQFDNIHPSDFQLAVDFSTLKSVNTNNTLPIEVRTQPASVSNLHFMAKSIEFFIKKE